MPENLPNQPVTPVQPVTPPPATPQTMPQAAPDVMNKKGSPTLFFVLLAIVLMVIGIVAFMMMKGSTSPPGYIPRSKLPQTSQPGAQIPTPTSQDALDNPSLDANMTTLDTSLNTVDQAVNDQPTNLQ